MESHLNLDENYSSVNKENRQDLEELPPNQTLYINNLNEKIKVDELKQALFHLFTQFGEVLEIQAKKNFRMKGQAFVVLKDINTATTAKQSLNGAIFFGKPLRMNYAKSTSDVVSKLSGKYVHKDKLKRDQERKRKRDEEYKQLKNKSHIQREQQLEKANRITQTTTTEGVTPNNILFIENLTPEINNVILKDLFSQYLGFRDVRVLSGKGLAFVEYDNEMNAGAALVGLNGLKLTSDCSLNISFAKK